MNKTIYDLSKEIHENAKAKGFWDKERNMGEMLMLIVSEVAEAMEADRKDRYFKSTGSNLLSIVYQEDDEFAFDFKNTVKDSFEDELSDAVIRIFGLAYAKGIDLETHIIAKMRYNATREHMHGKKY